MNMAQVTKQPVCRN